jgi:hypothetical protein
MKNYLFIPVITLLMLALITSCKKDEIPAVPELTPESSFSMDFNDFQQNKSMSLTKENWVYSALNVSFFSTIVSAEMTIPTLAFAESFHQVPVYIGDQTWQWSYSLTGIWNIYTAKLNGTTEKNKKVRWEMYIDKTGINGFSNFLWFEGTTTDSTAANWTVYEKPDDPSVLFDIAWNSNADYSQSTLKYTYRNSGSINANSTIEYGKTGDNSFNRYYTISLTSNNATININWNADLKYGRVKSPDYYKNNDWHCWNESHNDAWCE